MSSLANFDSPNIHRAYSSVPWNAIVVQKLLKTCSFTLMNMATVVYFESITHTVHFPDKIDILHDTKYILINS